MNDTLQMRCVGRFSVLKDIPAMGYTKVGHIRELVSPLFFGVELSKVVDIMQVPAERRTLVALFIQSIKECSRLMSDSIVMERSMCAIDLEDMNLYATLLQSHMDAAKDNAEPEYGPLSAFPQTITRIHAARTVQRVVRDSRHGFVDVVNCILGITEAVPGRENITVEVSGDVGDLDPAALNGLDIPQHVDYVLMRNSYGVTANKESFGEKYAERVSQYLQKKIVLTDDAGIVPVAGTPQETYAAFAADPRSSYFEYWCDGTP